MQVGSQHHHRRLMHRFKYHPVYAFPKRLSCNCSM